jgi:hypothetical protein
MTSARHPSARANDTTGGAARTISVNTPSMNGFHGVVDGIGPLGLVPQRRDVLTHLSRQA